MPVWPPPLVVYWREPGQLASGGQELQTSREAVSTKIQTFSFSSVSTYTLKNLNSSLQSQHTSTTCLSRAPWLIQQIQQLQTTKHFVNEIKVFQTKL